MGSMTRQVGGPKVGGTSKFHGDSVGLMEEMCGEERSLRGFVRAWTSRNREYIPSNLERCDTHVIWEAFRWRSSFFFFFRAVMIHLAKLCADNTRAS